MVKVIDENTDFRGFFHRERKTLPLYCIVFKSHYTIHIIAAHYTYRRGVSRTLDMLGTWVRFGFMRVQEQVLLNEPAFERRWRFFLFYSVRLVFNSFISLDTQEIHIT